MRKSSIEQMTAAAGGRLKPNVAADPVASLSAQLSLTVTEAAGAIRYEWRSECMIGFMNEYHRYRRNCQCQSSKRRGRLGLRLID